MTVKKETKPSIDYKDNIIGGGTVTVQNPYHQSKFLLNFLLS